MTRLVLVLGLVAFGTVVSLGVRERVEPAAAPGVDRDDPKALAEIRGAQVTQAAGELKDYTYDAGLQQLYEDGSLRLSNGFRVDVPEQADRDGFLVTGGEARVDADQDRFVFTRAESAGDDAVGDPTAPVLIRVSDGLGAETDTAIYSRQDGTVSMPGATTLRRMGMTAVGHPVTVDTNRSLATLDGEAHVSLAGDDGRATLDIWSNLAVLAHDDGYMNFDGGTRVSTGTQFLEADHTTAHFGADETALERLELHEHARIYIPTPAPGALREMLARDMTLAFEDTTRVLEQAILSGDTVIELAGVETATGAQIRAGTMKVTMSADGTDVAAVEAHDGVVLALPDSADGASQEIRATGLMATNQKRTSAHSSADTVVDTTVAAPPEAEPDTPATESVAQAAAPVAQAAAVAPADKKAPVEKPKSNRRGSALVSQGTPETGLNNVQFTEAVEYREQRAATAAGRAVSRVIRADRLEAGVKPGLSGLLTAQFLGNVRFEEDSRTATADEVVYDVIGGVITLNTVGEAGRGPTVTDDGIRIEGSTLTLSVDGSAIEAIDDVRSELTPETAPSDGATGITESTLPALLDSAQQTFATAGGLTYDPDVGQAAYTGGARLWQGETSFAGDTVSLDDQTGGLSASGTVTTTIQLVRFHESTGESAVSLTRVAADEFLYDEAARQATYDGKAVLLSDAGDMKADRIDVFLQADGRTLDRFEATGNVKLLLEGRWATGNLLVYDELTGRYDMEGAPVQIVEEVEPEEPAVAAPPPRRGAPLPVPSCSTMEGRKLTFYRSDDTVTVDGQQVLRTESKSGNCAPLAF